MARKLTVRDFQNLAVVIAVAATLCLAALTVGTLLALGILKTGNKNAPVSNSSRSDNSSTSSNIQLNVPAPTQVPACTSHNAIESRTWLEIAKDPDSHKGECLVVYGEVTQFDAATGNDTLRANVDGIQQTPQYGLVNYSTNTVLTGDSGTLSNVVQGDLFTANVTVLGSETYDTQIGGQTTVPELRIDSIQVTGHLPS